MRGIIGDPKGASDHLADPLARPDLPAKPVRFRPTVQERRQLGELLGVSLGAGPGAGWRRSPSSTPSARARASHWLTAPRRHPERGGDVLLFPARFFELPGASPPSFAPVQPGFLGFHRPNLPLL